MRLMVEVFIWAWLMTNQTLVAGDLVVEFLILGIRSFQSRIEACLNYSGTVLQKQLFYV